MAENTINVKVKQRTDTESNWASKNPVLLKGEMAISSDKNNKYKIGDGTSVWSVLSYAKADLSKSDVTTALGYTVNSNVPANAKFTDTTYAIATTSANGLMSKDMVTKLNGIASGATAVTSTTVSNWGFKKTDTNTWRGVQNNLTSTATDQSLSAYQGKVLKDLVDTKATFTYSSTQPTSPAGNAVWIG